MKKGLIISLTIVALAGTIVFTACHKKKCGPKKGDCVCPMIYAPVCGSDNKTYGNGCEAECAGVKSYSEGECAAQ